MHHMVYYSSVSSVLEFKHWFIFVVLTSLFILQDRSVGMTYPLRLVVFILLSAQFVGCIFNKYYKISSLLCSACAGNLSVFTSFILVFIFLPFFGHLCSYCCCVLNQWLFLEVLLFKKIYCKEKYITDSESDLT